MLLKYCDLCMGFSSCIPFTISRFPHSLTACKLISSLVYFVSFKRFLLSVCSSSNWKLSSFYVKKKRPLGLGSAHPIYLPGNVLLLRNVSQLPSALSSFSNFRQALASFLSFTLSSLTYRL